MSSPSPPAVKKDFGLKQGRLTLPPSAEYSSPGANYIAAASNTLPLATSTPVQREMLNYKITWTDKVRNVFRFRKKKKGGFSTDPDVVHFPQPFSRATGAMVHSTPKIFDRSTVSVENLAQRSSSEDDIPQSLLEDTLPGKPGSHSDKQKQKEKAKKKNITRKADQKQASIDDEPDGQNTSNVDSSVTEHDSGGQNSTLSPKSSLREQSSQQSSECSSSEDEDVTDGHGQRASPGTSSEWQEQTDQHIRRKKSIQSMDYHSHHKISIERPLSAGNSIEALNQDEEPVVRRKLTHNISDSLITDESRRSKKRKPERIKGPHKSRENLGRPTILDVDMKNQQLSSFEGESEVDFTAVPSISRLSTKAAHDKCGAAKNIKRRKATTKRSLFLHTEEEHGTSIVDPSATAQLAKSNELQKAEQMVQHLRLRPQQSSSASIAAKAVEKRNSIDKTPIDTMDQSPELTRTDSKRKFSVSALINKQILESPLKTPIIPTPSPKPQRHEPNLFEQVKLKPINNSPIKTELKSDTITISNVTKDKPNIPPIKEKPRRAVAPSPDRVQDLASPVKENRTNVPKLAPVNLDTDTIMDTKEAIVSMPSKDTRLPSIIEHKRSKSRRAKTVAQPVKTIGYMKDAPSKPAWIELAQQKTRRVSEALSSTDKLPQLSPSPAKHKNEDNTFFKEKGSPEGTDTSKESGLPADGYVRRRLRTFSQDQTPKAS